MQVHHDPRRGATPQRSCTPETLQAIRVMAQTPVYFGGGKIVFEENGSIELYHGEELIDELQLEKEDAAIVALNLWRELSTMPETMLEQVLQNAHVSGREGGRTMLEALAEKGKRV